MRTPIQHEEKRIEIMEKCFDCYCENGLNNTSIKILASACGMTSANLYAYFDNVDDLLIQSTAHCMAKVENEFMAKAPKSAGEVVRFFNEVPYWTAKKHGKKYRFMYQVYSSPKFYEQGKAFFEGVNRRYAEYAERLEPIIGISKEAILSMAFTLVRAAVHYAMFEDEYYMKLQIGLLIKAFEAVREGRAEADATDKVTGGQL